MSGRGGRGIALFRMCTDVLCHCTNTTYYLPELS